jgi:hypothetical protein
MRSGSILITGYIQSYMSRTFRDFFQDFRNMTYTHGLGNFSGVLLKIEKKCMTEILQRLNGCKQLLSKMASSNI